jgi:hypothetical protein
MAPPARASAGPRRLAGASGRRAGARQGRALAGWTPQVGRGGARLPAKEPGVGPPPGGPAGRPAPSRAALIFAVTISQSLRTKNAIQPFSPGGLRAGIRGTKRGE